MEKQEDAYRLFAEMCGTLPRPIGERTYSITWRHDGVIWTATVGKTLCGIETISTGKGRNRLTREASRSSDDTVLAIFPGHPGLIAHDNKSGRWNLPILTGEPLSLVRFDKE